MPWLAGTALMHSLIVTERRGSFKGWTLLLAISAFSLSLLGTFLVRSGVLTSVHSFATDPARGVFILGFLVIVIGGSLSLFAWRAPMLSGNTAPASFSANSREGFLLANNLLLTVADRGRVPRNDVPAGPGYAGTREDLGRAALLRRRVLSAAGTGNLPDGRRADGTLAPCAPCPTLSIGCDGHCWSRSVTTVLIVLTSGRFSADRLVAGSGGGALGAIAFAIGIFIATWVIAASLALWLERLREVGGATSMPWLARVRALPAGFYGMLLAHAGIGVFTIGVACVNTLQVEPIGRWRRERH
jgi:cytochrome c-type biogenesis protein CcmF